MFGAELLAGSQQTQRAPGRRCICTHQMAALFYVNDVMAAILKLRQHQICLCQSMHICVKNIPAKFHPSQI